ncbi:hypothetical protein CTP10_R63250 (plasmid) [Cupriavidus sp. P-10]|uniref:hypothetical protein n=1 Tax=Cupriavidus sp. P-10 TaxID=2027911 RepID=UPI000E2F63CA|nr:hypothetical protein [Cupriavidus sp. P-10]BDB28912.1 hypothetical protein CTP10_R63250 [Cupriavidus sp. P-10]
MQLAKLIAACGAALFLATISKPSVSAEMGCIVRDPAGAWFMRDASRDPQVMGKAVLDAANRRAATVPDPCLSGTGQRIPEALYARLATKRPDIFKPVEEAQLSAGSLSTTARRTPQQQPDYQYTSLDALAPVEYNLGIQPLSLNDAGRIIGWAATFTGDDVLNDVVFIRNKEIYARVRNFIPNVANDKGTAAGMVVTDPVFFYGQAAFARRSGIELIPRQPGEVSSQVVGITDDDVALVVSQDQSFAFSLWLYDGGRWTAVHLEDVGYRVATYGLSNGGLIFGNAIFAVDSANVITHRAYHMDPKTGKTTLFSPVFQGDTDTRIEDANKHDEFVGWSFIPGGIEHVGIWDRNGRFTNHFTQGIPEYPTISGNLKVSNDEQILIYGVTRPASERGNVYVVPRPGVRFNLLEAIEGAPEGLRYNSFAAINNRGDIIGFASDATFFPYNFLLERQRRR